ncbi:MAG: non-homologous end-joining DNA ligase [Candidatus Babeliales bacterium]
MNPILENLPPEQKKLLKKKAQPSTFNLMLATLTHNYFYDSDWLYEHKLDGERCVAIKKGKKVALESRNHLSMNISYPDVQDAIAQIPANVILDGEIVAFKNGLSDFSRLQQRMHARTKEAATKTRVPVYYYIFDIMYLDGYDLTQLPLITRKQILRKVMTFEKPLRYTQHKLKASASYFRTICKKGWEGLVVKYKNSTYQSKRSTDWLKFKCVQEQELVIGGYTDPQRSRVGFGAILVGYYKRGKLHYAGKIGTGFDTEELLYLTNKFNKLATNKNPFVNFDDSLKGVHWVKPQLVCEVGFTEWTKYNKLRHPTYKGLRRDKPAKLVTQEK